MKIKSLKQKILLSVSLALACAILLISGFSYHNLRQQILADGYAQIHSLGSEGARSILNGSPASSKPSRLWPPSPIWNQPVSCS